MLTGKWRCRRVAVFNLLAPLCALGGVNGCYRETSFAPNEIQQLRQVPPRRVEVTRSWGDVVTVQDYDQVIVQEKVEYRKLPWAQRRSRFDAPVELTVDRQTIRIQTPNDARTFPRDSVEELSLVTPAPMRGLIMAGGAVGGLALCTFGTVASGFTNQSGANSEGSVVFLGGLLLCGAAGLVISHSLTGEEARPKPAF